MRASEAIGSACNTLDHGGLLLELLSDDRKGLHHGLGEINLWRAFRRQHLPLEGSKLLRLKDG